MATSTTDSLVWKIGETAGKVWHVLKELIRSVDAPRDLVLQAIGWLAREEKIEIEQSSKGRYVWLR